MVQSFRKYLFLPLLLSFLLLFLVVGLPKTVFASPLHDAKAALLVGEKQGGYIGAVSSTSSAQVQALIASINSQRRRKYADIAKRNGTSLKAVEVLAGIKAIEKTPAGFYVEDRNGQWYKK